MTCPRCNTEVDQINRYGVEVEWFRLWDGSWSVKLREHPGSHFHVFCPNGHRIKFWADELPEELRDLVLAGYTFLDAGHVA